MTGVRYRDLAKSVAALAVVTAAAVGLYGAYNAWPNVEGAWRVEKDVSGSLYTFTRDGEFIVETPGEESLALGRYVQDGRYIKVDTYGAKENGGVGAFTLMVDFEGTDAFTTEGPIGVYIWQRKKLRFTRIPAAEVAGARAELNAGKQAPQGRP